MPPIRSKKISCCPDYVSSLPPESCRLPASTWGQVYSPSPATASPHRTPPGFTPRAATFEVGSTSTAHLYTRRTPAPEAAGLRCSSLPRKSPVLTPKLGAITAYPHEPVRVGFRGTRAARVPKAEKQLEPNPCRWHKAFRLVSLDHDEAQAPVAQLDRAPDFESVSTFSDSFQPKARKGL